MEVLKNQGKYQKSTKWEKRWQQSKRIAGYREVGYYDYKRKRVGNIGWR